MNPATREALRRLSPEKRALLEARLRADKGRLGPRPGGGPAPLSFAQERLFFLDQLEPDVTVYNVIRPVDLVGPLDVDALQTALDGLVERHEALRAVVVERDGEVKQQVLPPSPVELDVRQAQPELVPEEIARQAGHRFDLRRGPLLRGTLLRHSDNHHSLVLAMHHFASDEGSRRVLWRDISELYAAAVQQRRPQLPELPLHYPDYAAWQRRRAADTADDAALAAWRAALDGAPADLQLPADRPRPAVRSRRGRRLKLAVDPVSSAAVQAFAREQGATDFMVGLATFAALLSRCSGSQDLVIGVPVTERAPEAADVVGCFGNTLPLRIQLGGDPSFAELVQRVRAVTVAAFDHADVPLELILRQVGTDRDLSRNPGFQVLFNAAASGDDVPRLPGVEAGTIPFDPGFARFDVEAQISRRDERLELVWVYDADLFDHRTAERLASSFRSLLVGAVAEPTVPLVQLPWVATEEIAEQERFGRGPDMRSGAEHPSVTVRRLARKSPGRPAVIGRRDGLSFVGLDRRADAVANSLAAAGVRAGDIVAVCLGRSPEMVTALLGIWRAGAVYLPLDPTYPVHRLSLMLDDSGAAAVLADAHGRQVLSGSGLSVPVIDHEALDQAVVRPGSSQIEIPDPASPAYLLYTSGSTGRPKGVLVEHGSLTNVVHAVKDTIGLQQDDVTLAVTTLSFDISLTELLSPLVGGGSVVIADEDDVRSPEALADLIETHSVTYLQATPATWRLLLEWGWQGSEQLRAVSGGEALSPELAAALAPRVRRLWNGYGPTEAAIWTTMGTVDVDGPVTLGDPLPGVIVRVLDEQLRPVPAGVPGELCIGGACLASGYLGQPELTAERFVTDLATGERLYRSGDLVRWGSDDRLRYLGRLDQQVKLRGFRVELGEIESALAAHPGVAQAVVTAIADTDGEQQLAAHVVPAAGDADTTPAELRSYLTRRLPAYMVPATVTVLDVLPLSPNGKIDRSALPSPQPVAPVAVGQPLTSPMQQLVADVWTEVLGVRPANTSDDFFSLGGHSLRMAQVLSRLRRLTGSDVQLRALYADSTVMGMADALTLAMLGEDPSAVEAS